MIVIAANELLYHTETGQNYHQQTCAFCKKMMLLGVGDTLYGDKWYHQSCWKIITITK